MALSLQAYATSRGINQGSVSKAIQRHQLKASVGRTDKGRPCIEDPDLADVEWARAFPSSSFRVGGLPTPSQAPVPPVEVRVPPVEVRVPPVEVQPPPPDGSPVTPSHHEPSEAELADGARRERWYASELKRLALAEEEGTLVLAADVVTEWCDILATVRTKVLGLPTTLKQALPQLTPADVDVIDRAVRALLEDLAGPEEVA